MSDIVKQYKGSVVDVKLYDFRTTQAVFWSPRWRAETGGGSGGCNSFVLVETEFGEWEAGNKKCSLVSINGAGEVRWSVTKSTIERQLEEEKAPWWKDDEYGESLKAARHFGLIPARVPSKEEIKAAEIEAGWDSSP